MNREQFLQYAAGVYHGTRSVIRAVPADKLDYRPHPDMMSVAQVLEHLGIACGGSIKYVIDGNFGPLKEPLQLLTADQLPKSLSKEDSLRALDADEKLMCEIVNGWSEEEFQTKMIQPPWLPFAQPAWQFCLDMVDHLSGHRMQLFQYLKQTGEPVNTWTLYGAEVPNG